MTRSDLNRRLLFALFIFFPFEAYSDSISGAVISIADGDTLSILDASNTQQKIRLAAIDAPEKSQSFGQKSKQALSDICFSKHAIIKVVDTDRYGRTVGEVTCSGTNANEVMVRSGFAWVYRKYAKGYGHLYALEEKAKISKLGLWADPSPVPPWEWRNAIRGQ